MKQVLLFGEVMGTDFTDCTSTVMMNKQTQARTLQRSYLQQQSLATLPWQPNSTQQERGSGPAAPLNSTPITNYSHTT